MKESNLPEEKLLRLIKENAVNNNANKTIQEDLQVKQPSRRSSKKIEPRKVFFLVFFVSLVYFLSAFIYPLFLPKAVRLAVTNNAEVATQNISSEDLKIEDSSNLYRRQIFVSNQIANNEVFPAATSDIDLVLVGIVLGENPQAVIEDKKVDKIYYLVKGQFINDFQVEDIKEGKIILNRLGKRFELGL